MDPDATHWNMNYKPNDSGIKKLEFGNAILKGERYDDNICVFKASL